MQPRAKNRRQFITETVGTGIALILGAYLPGCNPGPGPKVINASAGTLPASFELMTWISIDRSGKVTILNHRAEMGQGSWQVVPQMIAEELEVAMDQINILSAPGNQKKYGSQITGGSSTVRGSYKHLLNIGASAREMLIATAAKKWDVKPTDCSAENGQVFHKSGNRSINYGDLVEDAAKLTPPKDVQLKPRKNYKLVGKPLPRKDIPLKTNGSAIFGIDKRIPGMLYASVERSPRIRGKVKHFDDSQTKTVPGVRHVFIVKRTVFESNFEGVAVVADNLWAAMQGRKLLKVEWDDSGFEHLSSEQLFARMHDDLKKPGLNDRTGGDFDRAFQKANSKVEAVYETPYQAHACMEPLNCIADVKPDSIEIWGPIQGPDWIQSDLSQRMGVPLDKVTVNMTFLGGGFGRKAFLDYPHEAAVISKEIKAPVQVVWTREDDLTQGPFRPGAVYGLKAGLSKEGHIEAFQLKTATQNMSLQNPGADMHSFNGDTLDGFCKPYYDAINNYSFSDIPTISPIPVMWWRSVYASTNGFAYESFMDEMAHAAGKDPLEFRRQHLDNERYQALIDQLSILTDWKNRGKNEGWGVAITECFNSVVGEVVKVSRKPDGKIKVDKVVALMDCGWYVNPDIIRQQVEGSIIMALGAATKHDIQFKDGKTVQTNFDTYNMSRIHEIPDIEVHVVDNDEKAGGVGEPGLPPLAPALCNAIFDLTGKRIRRLPFDLDKV